MPDPTRKIRRLMAHLPCVSVPMEHDEPDDEAMADYQLLIAVEAMQRHLQIPVIPYDFQRGKPAEQEASCD
jgi:hypothetical protein